MTANSTGLPIVVIHRLRHDPSRQACAYADEPNTHRDRAIRRCLNRSVARQLFRQLDTPMPSLGASRVLVGPSPLRFDKYRSQLRAVTRRASRLAGPVGTAGFEDQIAE
jgi:hypothetical protein